MQKRFINILNTLRFSENLADLFFILSRHKFSSIALATFENFNAEKGKKKRLKIRKAKCIEYIAKQFCIALFIGFAVFSCANKSNDSKETVTFIVNVPENTPKNKSVYISGNFEKWSGGKDKYKLESIDGKHQITLPRLKDKLQFKFTLGSWESVERNAKNKDIENRIYTFKGNNDTVVFDVASWSNAYADIIGSLPLNVTIFSDSLKIPQLNRTRRIWVYTPPNYKSSGKSYPVLYMHDAQNLFMDKTACAGEWHVDEILNQLSIDNGLELIVVGIDHSDEERLSEMSPWDNKAVENPQGDLYLDFIVKTLKPKIDKAYRTKTDKANTAILGASMGGLISHYAGFKYNDIFGKIGVFSPSYWISEQVFTHTKSNIKQNNTRLYLLIGTDEGSDMLPHAKRMKTLLVDNGFNTSNLFFNAVKDGKHNETLWRNYFPEAISWLFEKAKPKKRNVSAYVPAQRVNDIELASGKLMRIEAFPSAYVKPRPVDIWLPDNYSDDQTYSVLYMHDGQMLFDAKNTWNKQEWKVDEWASKLMKEDKTKDFIVVAIHSIADFRWYDLFPQKAYNFLSEKDKIGLKDYNSKTDFVLNGDNYLKFVVTELKPYIDNVFSTKNDKENTFVMGSSMGGLMSMYAISEYPDVFAGASCLSTHWVGAQPTEDNPFPEAIFKYMEENLPEAGKNRIYFDYGNKTLDAHYPQYAPRVDVILKAKGYSEKDSKNLFFENTDHSENAWNRRLDMSLIFLLGKN